MKRKTKLFGYRTHTLWKMIIATFYYLFCFILIVKGLFIKPSDGEVTSWIIGFSLLIPALMTSNFKIKKYIPILRHRKNISDIFGFLIFILLFLILSISFCATPKNTNASSVVAPKQDKQTFNNTNNQKEELIVHYIDVGQGDSIFIELSNDETILIDAGEKEYGSVVANYIKKLGYDEITYLIGTHPHSDHIGGFLSIIKEFNIDNIYMPKVASNSLIYEEVLLAIKDKDLSIKSAKQNVDIIDTETLKVYFLAPVGEYDNLNNYSAVLKLEYNDKSFLFMGDAEKEVENEIKNVTSCDVIKVGHHGSNTSSTKSFINLVNPQYAVISVGENEYNHPNSSVIKRWGNSGAIVYRTDLYGNIVISTDGYNLNVLTNN